MTPTDQRAAATASRPVAMVTHSYYEEDPRVRREAEALVAAGRQVDVFALRRPDDAVDEVIDGVRVRRLGVQRHQGAGLRTYLVEYLAFLARAGFALTRAYRRRRYALVQVHTLPDFLVFAAVPLRLAGVPVILDLHEAMPEFFRSRFHGRAGRIGYALLRAQEAAAIRFASAVITVNEALGDRLRRLGAPDSKLTIIPNAPSLARFDGGRYPERAFMADGILRLVYAGALSPIYELDVVLVAVARLAESRPELSVSLELYGRDFAEVPLRDLAAALRIGDRVTFHGRIPIEDVPAAIAAADIGLAPTRRSAFTDFSLSTKAFEYAAMARPVVASRLPMVERTFGDDASTYTPGDADDLVLALLRLVDDPVARDAQVSRALERVRGLAWEVEAPRFLALVDGLARR
ncbi:MAG: glycosyltransferase family 4 protein [Candidatus Limnocylindrales bacterium]